MKKKRVLTRLWPTAPAVLLSTLLCGGCATVGWLLHVRFPSFRALPLYGIFVGTLAIFCVANRIAGRAFMDRHFGIPFEERQPFLDARREAARRDSEGALREQGLILLLPALQLTLYALLALGMAVAAGMCGIWPVILPIWLLHMPISLHLSAKSPRLNRSTLVPRDQLPQLHALARSAAKAVGLKGDIRLEIPASAVCEVNRFGRTYVVLLGTMALASSTEDELYQDLLRTFALYAYPQKLRTEARWMHVAAMTTPQARLSTWVFDLFFAHAGARLQWDLMLAHFPVIYRQEAQMAACIRTHGDARIALNRLTKARMWGCFGYEYHRFSPILLYAADQPPQDYEAQLAMRYRHAMQTRQDAWCELLERELHPEGSSPILLREAREILGMAGEPFLSELVYPDVDSLYWRECTEAIAMANARVARELTTHYATERQAEYLAPQAILTEWEASDHQRPTSELSPVINAYRDLYRYREAEALCDTILQTEPNVFAQAHALYGKGQFLLRRYDTEGIDYIYRAMDINKNYMASGLEIVDTYCALCGLADELAENRRRSARMREAHGYNQAGAATLTIADHLEPETGLGEMLPEILAYMESVGGGCLTRIYLVRKVVSEDFFTSAFILQFRADASEEAAQRAYEAIFNYLDTFPVDWQFSLFLLDRNTDAAARRVEGSLVWENKAAKESHDL